MTKQTKIKHYTKRDYAAFAYLAPWIIGMLVLQLYPFLSSLVYSFCNYKITGTPSFTGLNNYIQLFTMDNEFWNSLKVTLAYTLYTVPGKLVMALAVAVFLNRDIKGINLIRTLYYIPSLFGGSVAVALLWKIMFMDNGVINAILTTLHLPNVQWLGDPNQALRTICMMEIWQFGSSMVMFLAALKNVPADLYEAAEIDGASELKTFWKIMVPLSVPVNVTVGLFTGLAYWNDWINALYYVDDPVYYGIQNFLVRMMNNIQFLSSGNAAAMVGSGMASLPSTGIRMALAVVGVLPIVVIYPFLQKYLTKGVIMGAVKG
mgnify:CR=1 FL=1